MQGYYRILNVCESFVITLNTYTHLYVKVEVQSIQTELAYRGVNVEEPQKIHKIPNYQHFINDNFTLK